MAKAPRFVQIAVSESEECSTVLALDADGKVWFLDGSFQNGKWKPVTATKSPTQEAA